MNIINNSFLSELINLNLNSIFFPSKAIDLRLKRSSHIQDTIILLWPVYLFFIFTEVVVLYLAINEINLIQSTLLILAVKGLFFPCLIGLEVISNYFILRLILPESVRDKDIDSVIGNSIAGGLFLLVPLVGDIITALVSKYLVFQGVKYFSNWKTGVLAVLLPIVLSITFLVFLFFCSALFLIFITSFLTI